MAEMQHDRVGGDSPVPDRSGRRHADRFGHLAVGYTDREDLDHFIEGEQGDLTIHGPVHTDEDVADLSTMGTGTTEGTPCLVIPLVRERIDEIQREVSSALDQFRAQPAPGDGRQRAASGESPRTIGETGGDVRGGSAGAIRTGSIDPDAE